ncbi:uncharacterized protein LOC118196409 isoform X1 [Stegodyphus dumicola]|uniref:uncharacterized protein LOC118196409 isoform X1 n=1 Tax=Stegodyphus dumicola TaxID=202533 RepID=UPI0015B080FB|nr:uncharacterized protein LOC118196409 isoform X1 [Stegodyphus dumicola]
MKVPEDQAVLAYHAHKTETVSKRNLKKEHDYDSNSCCFDSEDTFSDTSFSTLSAGTEDGLFANLDDEDELRPSAESELLELNKILTDVDASLRTKIMSQVESLIAKYRKCLSVAVQGKKLYQMELEKIHYTQRGKLRKLQETNKYLRKEMRKLQNSTNVLIINNNEQCVESKNLRMTSVLANPHTEEKEKEIATDDKTESKLVIHSEQDDGVLVAEKQDTIVLAASPTLPKQSPNVEAEPLGK